MKFSEAECSKCIVFSNARSFDIVYPFETAPATHGSVRVCYRYIIMMQQKKEQLNFSRKNGKTLLAVELNGIILLQSFLLSKF